MRSLAAAALAGFLVSGCNGPAANICVEPPPLDAVLGNKTDAPSVAEFSRQCVHRWAYRLAQSPDPAPVVADAVMGACADLVFRSAYAKEYEARIREESVMGFDSFTGQEANQYVVTAKELRRQALYHVVQARAGKCAVPV